MKGLFGFTKTAFFLTLLLSSIISETAEKSFLAAENLHNNLRTLEESHMRRSGILMHITSLPSKYGIGTLGEESYKFVDFLVKAKQRTWQMLPIQPTGYGDSPYQAASTFAGNPYLIDLDILIGEKLLKQEEVTSINWGSDPQYVDFGNMFVKRYEVLKKAFDRFKPNKDFENYVKSQKDWIEDYALFMALKEKFGYKPWTEWPEDLKRHKESALKKYRTELKTTINFHYFLQFKFEQQWNNLRNYAKSKGISLIGDVPIYVPMDSSDAWANPENFQLDKNGNPTGVAGVPPDAFTADGQLWGNPLYDWDRMKKDNFKWWIKRLRATGNKFDIIRIDHFRGLESYWNVPAKDTTARNGRWVKGPGVDFIKAIHEQLPDIDFIAEDLGYLTPEVLYLREYSKYPGMKILQFAFDSREPSNYLPHTYERNTVCYTGTHDNDTIMSWQKALTKEDRIYAENYLGVKPGEDLRWPLLKAGMASVSNLFVAQLQDYLGLGAEARMNRPGIMDGKNWIWRAVPGQITDDLANSIAYITTLYGRY